MKDKSKGYSHFTTVLYPISQKAEDLLPKPITYPNIGKQYKYRNFNRFKRSLKAMRNNTFDDINDFNMLQQLDTTYDAPYPKELITDASIPTELDSSEEINSSDLPQPITDEFNLLQEQKTSYDAPYLEKMKLAYSPFVEYDTNDKKKTNNIESTTETQNYYSYFSLPITDFTQFDMSNGIDDWLAEPNTTYEDVSLETQDISFITNNIETDSTYTVTEPEEAEVLLLPTTTKTMHTKITPNVNKLANAFKNTSKINHKNEKNVNNVNAIHKAKETSNQNAMAIYLDELLRFSNKDIQKQPNIYDNEEVVVYIDDEFRSTIKPSRINNNTNPFAWLKYLKDALNLIATKSHEVKAGNTLQTVPFTENNSALIIGVEQCRVTKAFRSESSTVANDYEISEEMLLHTNEMSSNKDVTQSNPKSSNDLKVKSFRRQRDIKSIDFDIEKEIRDKQNKNKDLKSADFFNYKEYICPPKDVFSSDNYDNLRDKNVGSNKDPEFSKIIKANLANTDKNKHRVKRNAQSYADTDLKTAKTDLDPPSITQKPEITLLSTNIQNLTTNILLKEGNHSKDLNAKQMNMGDFFQMVSEWFGTLAGVVQLNKTDPM